MKPIPEEKGSEHSQVWIVLLKRINGEFPEHKTNIGLALYLNKSEGYLGGFEVHAIRIQKEAIWRPKGCDKDIVVPEQEKLASNEEFGHYGWSYPTLDTVYKKFPMFKPFDKEIQNKVSKIEVK